MIYKAFTNFVETLKTHVNANSVIQTDKCLQKTKRNAQMLPQQKTEQNNETFEHKWKWFLKAPEDETVWLVEMHIAHIQNVLRWGFENK